tara:strand:+ start:108376 stop:108822 length:447 start_codon:yes stop_codon:yes gene_type:complete
MITIEEAIKEANSEEQTMIDPRSLVRLSQFMTVEQIEEAGLEFNSEEAKQNHEPKPFTEEAVIQQLKNDVEFGFEKALNKRGISASLMFQVVMFWNYVLQNELKDFDENNYAQYGLPLFKQTAVLYGFENPIGDDDGDEFDYSSEADW